MLRSIIFALLFFSGIALLSVPSQVAAQAQYIVQQQEAIQYGPDWFLPPSLIARADEVIE